MMSRYVAKLRIAAASALPSPSVVESSPRSRVAHADRARTIATNRTIPQARASVVPAQVRQIWFGSLDCWRVQLPATVQRGRLTSRRPVTAYRLLLRRRLFLGDRVALAVVL